MKRNREAGQSILLVAFALTVLLGMMGLAVDFGYLRHTQTRLQSAADSAAIAGAGNVPLGATGVDTAANAAAATNGFTLTTTASGCTPAVGEIAVNFPPCYLPSSQDPNNGKAGIVEAVLTQSTPTMFARIFGINSVNITARAEAIYNAHPNCIFSTDPSGSGAFDDSGDTFLAACGVVVESTDAHALKCTGSVTFQLPFMGVAGGDQACPPFLHPPVYENLGQAAIPSPADPLSFLTPPSFTSGTCGTTTSSPYTGYPGTGSGSNATGLTISGTATLNPGVYCGGIQLNSGASVTFNAGTYILAAATTNASRNALGLTINSGANASGTGLTFYNTQGGQPGQAGQFDILCQQSGSGGNISLSAPTSGTYKGILLYQDPNNTYNAVVEGQGGTTPTVLNGAIYLPGTSGTTSQPQLGYYYSDASSQYQIIVTRDVCLPNPNNGNAPCPAGNNANQNNPNGLRAHQCGGTIVVNSNYNSLTGGSPIKSKSGTLVE